MLKTELYFHKDEAAIHRSDTSISIEQFEKYAQDWLFEGEYRNHSVRTIESKRDICKKLLWFLKQRKYEVCGASELRQFLAYVRNGHQEIGGRWGNPKMTRSVSARTVQYYYVYLDGLFRWMVAEGVLPISPMQRMERPSAPTPNIQPFHSEHIRDLLKAAHHSNNPRRDEAIVLMLLDTGLRASELCALRMSDLDMDGRRATVLGKGNKHRVVFFGRTTFKALWQYLREQRRESDDPVFISDRGDKAGERLTRSGLLQLIERLGKAAGVQQVRCSPHTFRHTFAVDFLRNGGNSFSLQQLLGHANIKMTARYVSLAQADIENQHRLYSPADRLKKGDLL